MTKWSYYNCNENWSKIYKIIKTEQVQDILEEDMKSWCLYEAYNDKKEYKRGSPLWSYGRTDYFFTKIMDKANNYMNDHDVWSTYKKQRHNLGIPFKFECLCDSCNCSCEYETDTYFSVFDEIQEMFEPQECSLESMVLCLGANYLVNTNNKIASFIFPNENVFVFDYNGNDYVLIPSLKLIFDPTRFYFYENSDKTTNSSNPKIIGSKFEEWSNNNSDYESDISTDVPTDD